MQALAALPIGGRGGAARESQFLYHGTTPELAAKIHATGVINPADRRGEGQQFAWLTSSPRYAQQYGPVVIRVPRGNLPPTAIKSRIGPESYASPHPVNTR